MITIVHNSDIKDTDNSNVLKVNRGIESFTFVWKWILPLSIPVYVWMYGLGWNMCRVWTPAEYFMMVVMMMTNKRYKTPDPATQAAKKAEEWWAPGTSKSPPPPLTLHFGALPCSKAFIAQPSDWLFSLSWAKSRFQENHGHWTLAATHIVWESDDSDNKKSLSVAIDIGYGGCTAWILRSQYEAITINRGDDNNNPTMLHIYDY